MRKLRVGLIGIGSIARDHLAGLSRVDGAEIFALSSRNREALTSAAEKYGAKATYRDYRQLIANDEVEAVWVCTPNRLHYPMAMEVLEAGRHLFLEKPMADTLGECVEIADRANERQLSVSLCYLSRYMPTWRAVRRAVDEGAVGEPLMFVGRRMWWRDEFPRWWADEKRLAIPHFGSHSIDLGVWLLGGRGEEVFAVAASMKKQFPGESEYILAARMTTGAMMNLEFSMTSRRSQFDHILVGEQGTLALDGNKVLLNGQVYFETDDERLYGEAFRGEAEEFVSAVLEGRPSLTSAGEALKSMEIVEAALRSADSGRSVSVASIGPRAD
ncbi:MAG: Gfo/Idh/MocA family protein [Planctomycetota bacterium]